jgi:putative endonuclease
MRGGWVYIMTNRPNGTLYVGVTGNLARRTWEHRAGVADGFTRRYGLKRLVWAERHDAIETAIQREKTRKHRTRAWKVRLILEGPPPSGTTSSIGSPEVRGGPNQPPVKRGPPVAPSFVMDGPDPRIYGPHPGPPLLRHART